ncbi:MAG TPA: helix-turn-helix transcriptional regulator [Amycolatopsis sp.]|nr:helix-turn-helix transcriptional regulator [Amycolatopsis sp.]
MSRTELLLWLADELRRLRGSHSRTEAAHRLATTSGHIGHLETGRNPPTRMDIEGLLELYEARDQLDRLSAIRDASKRAEDWWAGDTDLLQSPVQAWLGLESVAARIHTFDSHVIPVLLQVTAYNEAALPTHLGRDQVRRLAALDRSRQAIQEERPAEQWAIIDEQVLYRVAGDATVMKEQLAHLVQSSRQPHVTIRILPRDRGLHDCTDAAFAIATMPTHFGPHPGGAFVPSQLHRGWMQNPQAKEINAVRQGACYRRPREVETFRAIWDRVCEQTLEPDESREVIAQAAQHW